MPGCFFRISFPKLMQVVGAETASRVAKVRFVQRHGYFEEEHETPDASEQNKETSCEKRRAARGFRAKGTLHCAQTTELRVATSFPRLSDGSST